MKFLDDFFPDVGAHRDGCEVEFVEFQSRCLQGFVVAGDAVSIQESTVLCGWRFFVYGCFGVDVRCVLECKCEEEQTEKRG